MQIWSKVNKFQPDNSNKRLGSWFDTIKNIMPGPDDDIFFGSPSYNSSPETENREHKTPSKSYQPNWKLEPAKLASMNAPDIIQFLKTNISLYKWNDIEMNGYQSSTWTSRKKLTELTDDEARLMAKELGVVYSPVVAMSSSWVKIF